MPLPEIKPYRPAEKVDMKAIIEIGESLDTEFRRQAGYQAWIGSLYAESKTRVRQLKAELEILEANIKQDIRKDSERIGVDALNSLVVIDSKYKIKQDLYINAQHKEELLKALVFALEAKKEMLVQLGANSRHELDNPELRFTRKKEHLKNLR